MRLLLVISSLCVAVFLAIYDLKEIRKINVANQAIEQVLSYQRGLLTHAQTIRNTIANPQALSTRKYLCQIPTLSTNLTLESEYDQVMQAELQKKAFDLISLAEECEYLNADSSAKALSQIEANLQRLARQINANALLSVNLASHIRKVNEQKRVKLATINGLLISALLTFWLFLFISWQGAKTIENQKVRQKLAKRERDFSRVQKAMVSILEDTRTQADNALKLAKDNQQLASIVQQSREAVIRLNTDKTLFHANRSAHALFKLDHDDLTHFTVADLFPDQDTQTRVLEKLNRLDTGYTATSLTVELLRTDGERAPFEITLSLLNDKTHSGKGYALTARDVTHLHEAQKQLQHIIELTPNALIVTDDSGQIRMHNAQAAHLFGYDREELNGQPVELLVPDAVRADHPNLRQSFFAAPNARAMGKGRDLTARKKDGSEVPVEIGLNPMQTDKSSFVVASIVDISERIRSQQKLQKINDQLQQRNYEMEQFIYTVSHDLKSPLVTIGGFTDKMRKSLGNNATEKQEHCISRIKSSIAHMESLLGDLLQLSRVIKSDLSKSELNTREAVEDVLATLHSELEQTDAKVTIDESLAPVYANERMFKQCLQNLISNAIKYRKPGVPPKIAIRSLKTVQAVEISIRDNGQGIDAKYHDKIFKIFERLEIGEGTGIGLTIVRTAMEKHNGRVSVTSAPGAGSTFTLTFPNKENLNHV